MKTLLKLGKIDYNNTGRKNCPVTLEIEVRSKTPDVAPYLDIDLKPLDEAIIELSISGNIWNPRGTDIDCRLARAGRPYQPPDPGEAWLYCAGQNSDVIRRHFRNKAVRRLCQIWDQYHLNGMRAGTRTQIEALKDFHTDDRINYYKLQCEFLATKGLLDVPIPEESRKNFDYKRKAGQQLPPTYRFGAAWLYESIPAEVIAEVRALIGKLEKWSETV